MQKTVVTGFFLTKLNGRACLLTLTTPMPTNPPLGSPLDPAAQGPDYTLAAAMGRQLSEPLGRMQDIVQGLLGTGKISRRKVQMLMADIGFVRALSMQSQQLLRLSAGPLRQSHERLRLDQILQQALAERTEALQFQGVELVQRLRPVEIILDAGLVSSLVAAAIDCATARGSRLLITLDMQDDSEHGLLTFKTLHTVVAEHAPSQPSGPTDTLVWRLLGELARASAVTLSHTESAGHSTLSLEFPRTVRQLEGAARAHMDTRDDSQSHMDSRMVSGQHILLVTSDDTLRKEASRVCAHMGLVLDTAFSAALAVRHCETEKPHLLIIDERDANATFQQLRHDLLQQQPRFPMIGIADDANTLAMSSWIADRMPRIDRSALRAQLPQVLALELAKA